MYVFDCVGMHIFIRIHTHTYLDLRLEDFDGGDDEAGAAGAHMST